MEFSSQKFKYADKNNPEPYISVIAKVENDEIQMQTGIHELDIIGQTKLTFDIIKALTTNTIEDMEKANPKAKTIAEKLFRNIKHIDIIAETSI